MTIHDNHRQQQRELERVHTFLQAHPQIAAAEGFCISEILYIQSGFTPTEAKMHWPAQTQIGVTGTGLVNLTDWNVLLSISPQAAPSPDPLPDEAATAEHRAYLDRLEEKLHELKQHPDFEYSCDYGPQSKDWIAVPKARPCHSGHTIYRRRKLSPEQNKTTETQHHIKLK